MIPEYQSSEAVVERLRPAEPVYCLRPDALGAAARRFLAGFPGRVLYAVKSNPMPEVLDVLWAAGVRDFDTASLAEIAALAEQLPAAGAYFMHPVKGREAIAAARRLYAVRHLVVDHPGELAKLAEVLGEDDLTVFVRLATAPGGAVFDLSEKFGASPGEAAALLRAVVGRGYRPALAFHCGSQCTDPAAFGGALERAGEVLAEAGVAIEALDVGGGFPVDYGAAATPPLEAFFAAIERGVEAIGLPPGCELLAEPGRALVAEGMSLLLRVELRKGDAIYLNDGVHGSLSGPTIGIDFPTRVLPARPRERAAAVPFTVYGPTCDGLDVLPGRLALDGALAEGDWIEFGHIGAYGAALRTQFNGFQARTVVSVRGAFGAEREAG